MEDVPEEREDCFRRRPAHPAARCRKNWPARAQWWCLGRESNRLTGMDRAIGPAALSGDRLFQRAFLLWPAMVAGTLDCAGAGSEVDCGDGLGRPAPFHRA